MTKAKIYSSWLMALLAVGLLINVIPAASAGPDLTIIIRDEYGVPHIYSGTQEGVFYGFGYAQAEDVLPSLMLNYLTAKGTLSETFGPFNLNCTFAGYTNYESDYFVKLLRIPQGAAERYEQIDSSMREVMIEPFAAGINAYINENYADLPSWITDNAPVTGIDVAAMGGLTNFVFSYGGDGMGSNQWAVSPERSATGNAMYGGDPHLPWDGILQWYEVHLCGPGINVAGIIFFGLPFIGIGHNEYLAWSQTVNQPDLVDMWIEMLNPSNDMQYLYDGAPRDIIVRFEMIDEDMVPMLYTHHGAVVEYNITIPGLPGRYAIAMNYSANGDVRGFLEFYLLDTATNLDEFKDALAMLAVPQFNFMYADIYGNIFYVWNAMCPSRSPFFDWSEPVPGWISATEWGPMIIFEDLPQVTNPDSGWLQNCNIPPWNVTVDSGIEFGAYPSYLTPLVTMGEYSRGQRLTNILAEDESVRMNEMKEIGVDVYVLRADGVVPLLPRHGKCTGELRQAIKILEKWDRYATKDSVAMTIFAYLMGNMGGGKTPIEALEDAVDLMLGLYGTIEVPWGAVHGVLRGDTFFGLSGGPGGWGILNPRDGPNIGGVWYCGGGSSFIMVVELEEGNVKACTTLPYGESNDPASPHFDDQLAELYSQDKLKPAWFYLTDVITHAESFKILTS